MTLLWTVPRVWATNDPITKEKLNAISDDLTYLYNPSRQVATVRGGGTNQSTAATTPTVLDAANYQLNVELLGTRGITVELQGLISNNTLAALTRFDVLIDGSIYASSLTATNVTNGLWTASEYVAANNIPIAFKHYIPSGTLSAGFHTFVPVWWVSAGTGSWIEASVTSQFSVGEYQ